MSVSLLESRESWRLDCQLGRPGKSRSAAPRRPSTQERSAAHIPVMARELLELTEPHSGQTAIDCTFGAGGHARLVAQRLGQTGTLIAIDRDPLAEEHFAALAREVSCSVRFIRGGYAETLESLAREGLVADVIYFDLGMSSMQVDTRERGFSYSYDAPLDMRMDPAAERNAGDIVREYDQRSLARVLRDYGEERHSSQIAAAIVRARQRAPITTTLGLVEVINSAIPTPARFAGSHPAKRVFQALRIAVNEELTQLECALPLAWGLLRKGGVLGAISFHSLEDRRVKHFLADRARSCVCPPDLPICVCGGEPEAKLISRRAIVPGSGEITRNPRSASARLRGARKLLDMKGGHR